MKKVYKNSLVLGLILCLILCAALFVACDPDKNDPPTATYTVTVTCEDAQALTDVKVSLKNSAGEVAAQKALEQGKATFELAPANYTATLSGVPEGYTFEDGALTATKLECTIEIALPPVLNTYTVTINYPAVKDVYGNVITAAGPGTGVTVSLYVGQLDDDNLSKLPTPPELAATKQTDDTGKAVFELPGDLYTVVVSGLAAGQSINYRVGSTMVKAYTVDLFSPTLALPLKEPTLWGLDEKCPIALQLGPNEVPLSREVLEKLNDMDLYPAVYYTFTPEESGEYTFTTTKNAKITEGEGFDPYEQPTILINGEGSFVLTLEKGKPHMLLCSANNSTDFSYTITIERGGESQSGSDFSATPFETFEGPHSVTVPTGDPANDILENVSGNVAPVWYSFTATENATYILSDPTQTLWLEIFENDIANPTDGWQLNGDEGDDHIEFTVKEGTTYYFWICTWSEDPGTVTFTITKK